MIKIFTAAQIREIDKCTIGNQGISSIDLMERASLAVYEELKYRLNPQAHIYVFAGSGNNGGDALAIARMLLSDHFRLQIFLVSPNNQLSADCKKNKERLSHLITIQSIREEKDIPRIPPESIIIDGLFGSGLNRPIEGIHSKVITAINKSGSKVYSIDIPSGLFVEDNSLNNKDTIVKADEVFTFQFPKLSLLLPDSGSYSKKMSILDIGLCQKCIDTHDSSLNYLEKTDIISRIKYRETFAHKGDFGHALLISGSSGKMGAAIMSARACLRAGAGLLTVHSPKCGLDILQTTVPEAMVSIDSNPEYTETLPAGINKYTSVGIGPGTGTHESTRKLMHHIFDQYRNPIVIDADAINLIAGDDDLKRKIPPHSILTPHVGEFERFAGKNFNDGYSRLMTGCELAHLYDIYIILKGAHSAIISPKKEVFFNSTGNPGMSTAGSGDVLTGIATSLLAQNYSPEDAAIIGTFLHGYAGDIASEIHSEWSMLASDIIKNISKAYKKLSEEKNIR